MSTQTVHTLDSLRALIQSQMESTEPDAVLDALRPMNGKMLTTRVCEKMLGGKDHWRLDRNYGMTHLQTDNYWRTHGNEGISLLLGHTETSFPIDVDDIEKRNPAYFSGRRQRNDARVELLSGTRDQHVRGLVAVLNSIATAQTLLANATAAFETFTEYDKPFSYDKYALERLVGLREPRK